MPKYRKKPVVIEADVYELGMEDGFACSTDFCLDHTTGCLNCYARLPFIKTLEGNHFISKGDYIITGVKGEKYPCKPDIFHQTYELVVE